MFVGYNCRMASKKNGRGRPTGKSRPETRSVGFRLTEAEYQALSTYARENDRTFAAEAARAVRKYLRDLGLLPTSDD